MGQRLKVRFDRAYRGLCEIVDEAKLEAKVVTIPHGGLFNVEDRVKLAYDTRKEKVRVEKTNEKGEKYETLEERDTLEREGDPYIHDLVNRVWPRRSYVKTKGDAGPLVAALKLKYWPVEQLEGIANEIVVAHPVKTRVGQVAAAAGVRLLEDNLELQEAED